ncbi:MAG: 30S ribosomal protein S20 [Christensenellales bacterium]|jgi:small subunit ribosomal protein S20
MANIKSNKKRMITSREARDRNRSKSSKIKTLTKKYEALIAEGNVEEAKVMLPQLLSEIDKSGLFKANNCSRKASRFTRMLNDLENSKK